VRDLIDLQRSLKHSSSELLELRVRREVHVKLRHLIRMLHSIVVRFIAKICTIGRSDVYPIDFFDNFKKSIDLLAILSCRIESFQAYRLKFSIS
jgi:hypothetical protein